MDSIPPITPKGIRFKALVICLVLSACANHAKEEDVDAIKTLRTWKGQNIQLALDKLGPPDNVSIDPKAPVNVTGVVSTAKKNSVYLWVGQHEVNRELEAQSVGGNGHSTIISHANTSSLNRTESCYLKIWASADGTMRKFSIKGKSQACQPLAEKINTDQPLQM